MDDSLIENADAEKLRSFLKEEFRTLKRYDAELYDDMRDKLYVCLNGNHFDESTYARAVAGLGNLDGTGGPHWKVADITNLARTKGLKYDGFNEYDFAYAMNMVYSDFYGVVGDSVDTYYRIAKAFIEDKDAPHGKAYLYWKAMSRN